MKKLVVLFIAVFMVFGMPLNSQAVYYEEFTGSQSVYEGSDYIFQFDMWYSGTGYTDSSLKLTTDASGAFGSYSAGYVYIKFYSTDIAREKASVSLAAYGDGFSGYYDLGTFAFDAGWYSDYYEKTLPMTQQMLDAFSIQGWGDVKILATNWSGVDNNFTIKEVGLGVATVPEPTSLLLLGLGLLGIAGWRRK